MEYYPRSLSKLAADVGDGYDKELLNEIATPLSNYVGAGVGAGIGGAAGVLGAAKLLEYSKKKHDEQAVRSEKFKQKLQNTLGKSSDPAEQAKYQQKVRDRFNSIQNATYKKNLGFRAKWKMLQANKALQNMITKNPGLPGYIKTTGGLGLGLLGMLGGYNAGGAVHDKFFSDNE